MDIRQRVAGLSIQDIKELRRRAVAALKEREFGLAPREPGAIVPLSPAQARIWADSTTAGIPPIAGEFHLRGDLDVSALRRALDRIVQRHEILRTRYSQSGAAVLPVAEFVLEEHDIRGLPSAERRQRLAVQRGHTAFDVTDGPLLRGWLFRMQDHERILLVQAHPLVADAASFRVLLHELRASYAAQRAGEAETLEPLGIQFGDYAVWQQQWLRGKAAQQQLAYWKQHLDGAPARLELPYDHERPAQHSSCVALSLGSALTDELRTLCSKLDVTLEAVLFAGFAIVLARLSGQADVVVGVPAPNRQQLEALIGPLGNMLALRVLLHPDPTVGELLQQVLVTLTQARGHQQLPYEQLVQAVSVANPSLFQAAFELQSHEPVRATADVDFELEPVSECGSVPGLVLSLREQGNDVVGYLSDTMRLLEQRTVERWVEHYRTVLMQLAIAGQRRVAELTLLSAEQAAQLQELNPTAVAYPMHRCLHELIEEQVQRAQTAIAVISGEEQLSYGELSSRANQLARYLLARGVQPEDRVALCVERGVLMVVAVLGILKAGAAYVALDPGYNPQRMQLLLGDTRAKLLLTQQSVRKVLGDSTLPLLMLDVEWQQIEAYATHDLERSATRAAPDRLAYVCYTSGSSGQPKGVMVEHRSVVNHSASMAREFALGPGDRVLQFASYCVDTWAEELFPALLSGATVVMRPGGLPSADQFVQLLQTQSITVLSLPTPYWHVWVASLTAGALADTALRLVVVSGERAELAVLRQWYARVERRVQWLNVYGTTETTISSTVYRAPADIAQLTTIPIGKPIANTRVHVLDERGEPVPLGVIGEICIAGAGVARGYMSRAELTQQYFVSDRFAGAGRMYHTRDLGRWRADGTLEYIARQEHHARQRATRMELADVEAQLRSLVTLRAGTAEQPPLFLVHELSGDVWPLYLLAKGLPESLQVMGLVLPATACLESVERLAAAHVQAIRRVQPQGPYRLAGHSVGGVVAYAIAQQLLAAGSTVSFVGLIDSNPPGDDEPLDESVTGDIPMLLQFLDYQNPNIPRAVMDSIGSLPDFDAALVRCKQMGMLPETLTAAQLRRWIANVRASLRAAAVYAPPSLAANVVFFASDEVADTKTLPYWRALLGAYLREVRIGGSHFTIIRKPNVDTLAQEVARALQD